MRTSILISLITFVMAPPAMACQPLLSHPLHERLLAQQMVSSLDAPGTRVESVDSFAVSNPSWVWGLDRAQPRLFEPSEATAKLIVKPSGHPILILYAEGEVLEVLPIPGLPAAAMSERSKYLLSSDGRWLNQNPTKLPRRPDLGTGALASRGGEPLVAWRKGDRWTLTDLGGTELTREHAFVRGDVLEFSDGQRVIKRPNGQVQAIPIAGQTRVFVTTLDDGALKS